MPLRRLLSVLGLLVFAWMAVARAHGHATPSAPLPNPRPQAEGMEGPRAVTYRAFLPTTLRHACPVVDDFSSPNSGWPDFDETGGDAGYVDEEPDPSYSIGLVTFHSRLVSRGDRWDNSRRLQVMVNKSGAQVGLFGLALGIDDGGRAYTGAMIDVEHGQLRLVHYSDSEQTPLGEWTYVDADGDGTVMTVTGNPATGQATLTLDDALTIALPDITGGIGFVARAGRGRVVALYDDYVFVDTYCPEPP